jgi:hypothetical protein
MTACTPKFPILDVLLNGVVLLLRRDLKLGVGPGCSLDSMCLHDSSHFRRQHVSSISNIPARDFVDHCDVSWLAKRR